MLHNGTGRGQPTPKSGKFEFNTTFAGFAGLALILAIASMREPFLVSRVVLFVLATISAAAPFVFFAIGVARQKREEVSNAISRERRHDQTRVEIRRIVKAKADVLAQHRAANDDAEAWSKAVERFAKEDVLPAMSHAIPRSEREMWIMEIRVQADALALKPAAAVAPANETAPVASTDTLPEAETAFTAECADRIAAAGWETEVDAQRVRASLGDSKALFECLCAEGPVGADAVHAFRTQLEAQGMERGAIIATQPFTPAALQAARASGMGLIKPVHVPTYLEWAARGAEESARAG